MGLEQLISGFHCSTSFCVTPSYSPLWIIPPDHMCFFIINNFCFLTITVHEYTTITLPCPPIQIIFYQWVGWDQSCHRQPIQVLVGGMCTPLLQGNNIYQYKSAALVVSITSDIVILIIDVAIISATPPLVLLFLWPLTPFLTLVMIPK